MSRTIHPPLARRRNDSSAHPAAVPCRPVPSPPTWSPSSNGGLRARSVGCEIAWPVPVCLLRQGYGEATAAEEEEKKRRCSPAPSMAAPTGTAAGLPACSRLARRWCTGGRPHNNCFTVCEQLILNSLLAGRCCCGADIWQATSYADTRPLVG